MRYVARSSRRLSAWSSGRSDTRSDWGPRCARNSRRRGPRRCDGEPWIDTGSAGNAWRSRVGSGRNGQRIEPVRERCSSWSGSDGLDIAAAVTITRRLGQRVATTTGKGTRLIVGLAGCQGQEGEEECGSEHRRGVGD